MFGKAKGLGRSRKRGPVLRRPYGNAGGLRLREDYRSTSATGSGPHYSSELMSAIWERQGECADKERVFTNGIVPSGRTTLD
jgi:hypothetical protein